MSNYEIYGLVLCTIVLVALTVLFSAFIVYTLKLSLRLIRHGAEDEKIKTEYSKKRRKACLSEILDKMVSAVFCVLLIAVCGFATYVNIVDEKMVGAIPVPKVVLSASMETIHKKNTNLTANGITNQFSAFDIILLHELPAEEDLKVFDIVAYEKDGEIIVHRIVAIEEKNYLHPNERYFVLQGDAVGKNDSFPVLYSQMRGIYRDQRVPFVGSFVCFMQSPAGYMCVLLVVLTMFLTPIMERKIDKEMQKRWELIKPSERPAPIMEIAVTESVETPIPNIEEIPDIEEITDNRIRLASVKRGWEDAVKISLGKWTKKKKTPLQEKIRLAKLQTENKEEKRTGRVKLSRK